MVGVTEVVARGRVRWRQMIRLTEQLKVEKEEKQGAALGRGPALRVPL